MRSRHPTLFLSKKEKERIVAALHEAEKETSGEIRVHFAKGNEKEIFNHAKEIFEKIGMTKTKHRNGVLIFLEVKSKHFAILGDQGIHDKVPENFWNQVVQKMALHFKQDRFGEGIVEGILMIGKELKAYFPPGPNDTNEIPDRISHSY